MDCPCNPDHHAEDGFSEGEDPEITFDIPQCLFNFDPVRGSEDDVNGSFTCGMCGENFLTG